MDINSNLKSAIIQLNKSLNDILYEPLNNHSFDDKFLNNTSDLLKNINNTEDDGYISKNFMNIIYSETETSTNSIKILSILEDSETESALNSVIDMLSILEDNMSGMLYKIYIALHFFFEKKSNSLNFEEDANITDELACALRLIEIKSRYNLIDDAFHKIILAVNHNDISFHRIKGTLKYIVLIVPIWVDMCSNSCCAYTGSYKYHNEYEFYYTPRFRIEGLNQNHHSQCQMAYFSIKDRLLIQYQNPTQLNELRYHANYIHH